MKFDTFLKSFQSTLLHSQSFLYYIGTLKALNNQELKTKIDEPLWFDGQLELKIKSI